MTKKFWNDWQMRLGETKAIRRWLYYGNGCQRCQTYRMVGQDKPSKFLSFDFKGDTVEIVYEVTEQTQDRNYHSETHRIRLDRTEIVTVEFIKQTC